MEEIEATPPIEEDIRSFNKMFDETFISLYPDFVEKFNALLAPGEAITPKGNDILTPELRVFALIKLGINDSSKIASLLHFPPTPSITTGPRLRTRPAATATSLKRP